MDRLDTMSLLLTVVDSGSLSAAGRRLNIPLATVSRHISELETRLKTRLLQRTSRRLALTDAGQAYVQSCRRILEDVEQAERSAAGEYAAPRGRLAVSCYVAFGRLLLVPIVAEFLAAYPEVDVRLVLTDGVVSLHEGEADVGLRFGPLSDSSLMAVRVGAVRQVLCASPAYLAARGTPVCLQDLAVHDCVTFLGLVQADVWAFRAETVRVRSRLVLNNVEAAVAAAQEGAGITCVFSYLIADAVRAGRLAVLSPGVEPAPLAVSLVYPAGGMLPLKLRAFLDFCVPRLKARLTASAV
jgi:DNA-binding transcriptional LysR family regulator